MQIKQLAAVAAVVVGTMTAGHANALTVLFNATGVNGALSVSQSVNLGTAAYVDLSLSSTATYTTAFYKGIQDGPPAFTDGIDVFTVTLSPAPVTSSVSTSTSIVPVTANITLHNDKVTSTYSLNHYLLGAGNYTLSITGANAINGSYNGLLVTTAPVPEPETYAMMLAGLGALGFLASRRRG